MDKIEKVGIDSEVRYGLLIAFSSFAVPFLLGHNQLATGVFVNFFLFWTAKNYRAAVKYFIFFPSLVVLARGLIFGPFTPFLFYFIPFIWLGNWVLVKLASQGHPLRGCFGKMAVLYLAARVYFALGIVPEVFLTSMGVMQVATAGAGFALAMAAIKTKLLK